MRPDEYGYSDIYGFCTLHPIINEHRYDGMYAVVFENDIRKESPKLKKVEVLCKFRGEFIFALSQEHLEVLYELYNCDPFPVGDDIDAERFQPQGFSFSFGL